MNDFLPNYLPRGDEYRCPLCGYYSHVCQCEYDYEMQMLAHEALYGDEEREIERERQEEWEAWWLNADDDDFADTLDTAQ